MVHALGLTQTLQITFGPAFAGQLSWALDSSTGGQLVVQRKTHRTIADGTSCKGCVRTMIEKIYG